ncbi:MAG: hypothetical protein ACRENQ_03460, partial [Gemmatimonadaceae bacterium]
VPDCRTTRRQTRPSFHAVNGNLAYWRDQTETRFGPDFSHFFDHCFLVRHLICPSILKRRDFLLYQSSDVEWVFDPMPEDAPMIRLKVEVTEVE